MRERMAWHGPSLAGRGNVPHGTDLRKQNRAARARRRSPSIHDTGVVAPLVTDPGGEMGTRERSDGGNCRIELAKIQCHARVDELLVSEVHM